MARRGTHSLKLLSSWVQLSPSCSLRVSSPSAVFFSLDTDRQREQASQGSLLAPARLPVCLGYLRGFASTGSNDSGSHVNNRASDAAAVLKNLKIGKLHEQLRATSETVPYINKETLLTMVQESEVASTHQEAEQTCAALNDAGLILQYQNKVYLRPAEVAELILQALPDTTKDLQDKLTVLQQEIEPLEQVKRSVDRAAHTRSTLMLWGGLLSTCAVWGICFRLTFWELSWDVMEPVTYFIGSGLGISFYLYFLVTQREFAYQDWKEQTTQRLQADGYAKKHLDITRYQKLKKDIERYTRYLHSDTLADNVKAKNI